MTSKELLRLAREEGWARGPTCAAQRSCDSRGAWQEPCGLSEARAASLLAIRQGDDPQRPAAEHPIVHLEAIHKHALAASLPYQTLLSSLLRKYASGRL